MDFISKFTGIQPKINLDQEGQATPDQPDPSAGIGNIPDAVENLQAPAFFTEDPVAADPVIPDLKIPTESEKETIRLFETAKKEFLRNLSFYVNSPKDFGSYLQKIYGPDYDHEAGERIRQMILNGDESWLPTIEFVSGDTLQGHDRAVDPSSGKIYFNNKFFKAPQGDEPTDPFGNPFKNFLASPETIASKNYEKAAWSALRNQLDPADANDMKGRSFGTIYLNGQPTVVEWLGSPEYNGWNPYPPEISK